MNDQARERTAVHEAGHAVLCCVLRVPFRRVTIKPRGDSAGRVVGRAWPASFRPDVSFGPHVARRLEAEIMVLFGGYVAEREHFGDEPGEDGWSADREKIADLILYLAGPEAQRRVDELRARSLEHLRDTWPAVEAVARRLLEAETLKAPEVRRVYRAAMAQGRTR